MSDVLNKVVDIVCEQLGADKGCLLYTSDAADE